MILTEEEAKTKRCQDSFPAATANRNGIPGYVMAPIYCIGSACMAWRWWGTIRVGDAPLYRGPVFVYEGDPTLKREDCLGYCGKAGKP